MEDAAPPLSLDQVESLIFSLYQRNHPDVIVATQASLSQFQGSPQAWSMIHLLLERPDEKVRFFGALTVIIKLNKESSSLSDAEANELLVHLVGWYLDALSQAYSPLVSRKLSSAVATHFIHFHRLWPRYLRHLIVCLASRQSHSLDAIDGTVDTAAVLGNLQPGQLQAALWVVTSVMEDVSRIDLNTNKGLYDALLQTVTDAVALMATSFTVPNGTPATHGDSTRCFQSWVWFAQRASSGDNPVVNSLKPLAEAVIASLSVEELFDSSAELLVDILANCPSLLTHKHYEYMASLFEAPWAQERYRRLLQGDFEFDSMQFGQLLLAFGEAKAEALMQSSDELSQRFLAMLCGLLAAEGFPVVNDKIFVSAIEFWSTFIETLADMVHFDQDASSAPWAPSAISHALEAVSNAWHKITYPPSEEFNQWDSSDRVGFHDARKDVVDLLQAAYTIVGPRLAMNFANLTLSALASSAWLPLEAAAFCLGGLADCGREDLRFDQALTSVFASPLFSILQTHDSHVHPRTRQTCLSLIEQYTEYFERNVDFLAPALRLLFAMLREQSMAASASKSILRLCSSCRHHLHTETDGFLDEYKTLLSGKRLDCLSSERVLGAIACIAQAIPDTDRRHIACAEILELIESDVELAQGLAAATDPSSSISCQGLRCFGNLVDEPPALHVGLGALRGLVNVGRGFQSPSEPAIDLDADHCRLYTLSAGLVPLHEKIMGLVLRLEDTFGGSSEVTELLCSLLRYRQKILGALLIWVISLLKQISEPERDPELAQNGVEFVSRVLSRSPATVLGLQPVDAAEFLFMFTIRVLDGKEPLPKVAAAEFWTTFVGLQSDNPESQEAIKGAMDALGPPLTQSLARNIGGNASRSELDRLSEPVKKLVSRHPKAREWLQSGLSHSSFPSDKVSSEQKILFVKKLVSLRGSRATNQVIRDFWLSARGSNFAYVS
ncbi:importin 13 [Hirsutella rhossiliensis]|uniref:Importin 13 n=1 Tax=Hirsutella rhossiliensis TaxID=111463 RepID=A0A9P8MRZ9_9HYPO|nr:importin 13 [Hirsutella rhossiliensis]KAH0960347.1 importin 13 [Hirsutella rhossiliensis]